MHALGDLICTLWLSSLAIRIVRRACAVEDAARQYRRTCIRSCACSPIRRRERATRAHVGCGSASGTSAARVPLKVRARDGGAELSRRTDLLANPRRTHAIGREPALFVGIEWRCRRLRPGRRARRSGGGACPCGPSVRRGRRGPGRGAGLSRPRGGACRAGPSARRGPRRAGRRAESLPSLRRGLPRTRNLRRSCLRTRRERG